MKKILLNRIALFFAALLIVSKVAWADEIFYANNRLTFGDYMGAYTGEDAVLRRQALVYLYGVIDATEKKEWCSFQLVKSSELISSFYTLLRKVDKSRYDERAAHVITDILRAHRPCGGK
ncbi:MAG: hypothetical protein FWG26_01960 [Betaproteobacteria bacterium]|nr:hypothetical protein [Betaproteobacteria bacterium]